MAEKRLMIPSLAQLGQESGFAVTSTTATLLRVRTYQSGKLNAVGWIVGVGLSLTLFQHMASGVRHLFLDTGANFELKGNKTTAMVTFAIALIATIAFWLVILEKLNG